MKRIEELFPAIQRAQVIDARMPDSTDWSHGWRTRRTNTRAGPLPASSRRRTRVATRQCSSPINSGRAVTRWTCATGASPARYTPRGIGARNWAAMLKRKLSATPPDRSSAVSAPENARHRKVLEALMGVVGGQCSRAGRRGAFTAPASRTFEFFEQEAAKMAARLPNGLIRRVRSLATEGRRRETPQTATY